MRNTPVRRKIKRPPSILYRDDQLPLCKIPCTSRLERVAVRAEAIAMRASDDLLKVVAFLPQEINHLVIDR